MRRLNFRLPASLRQTMLKLLHRDALQRQQLDTAIDYQRLLERDQEQDWERDACAEEPHNVPPARREFPSDATSLDESAAQPTIQPSPSGFPFTLLRWLQQATEQMRWKRARPYAARELKSHLLDQYEAFRADGMDESAAAQATVNEMGDAVEVGTHLDRAWRPQPDWLTIGLILVIAAVGMVLQAVLYASTIWDTSLPTLLGRYLLGVGVLIGAYLLDYTWIGRHGTALYILWVVVGVAFLFKGKNMGGLHYDLRQWLNWFPPVFAGVLYAQHRNGCRGIRNCLLALLVPCFLCLATPYTSGLVSILAVTCLTLVVAIGRGLFGQRTIPKLLLGVSPLLLGAILAVYPLLTIPHFRQRIVAAFRPLDDSLQSGYAGSIVQHAMFGVSLPSNMFAPNRAEAETVESFLTNSDFFLALVKYKWGWLAFALTLGAVLVLLARGFWILRQQTGVLAFFLNKMILLTLTVQTALYLHQTCGFMLVMSNGLPLLSYGTTYLIQTMAFLGLMLSTRRMDKLESNLPPRRRQAAHAPQAPTPTATAKSTLSPSSPTSPLSH